MRTGIPVFVGPTISVSEAQDVFEEGEYRPPVKAGDVQALFSLGQAPVAIGIIDGYFHRVPSVWHKEILYALSLGVPVYGASSMGALRAAEMADFGMIGVGRIYEFYRAASLLGKMTSDDEVVIAHAEADAKRAYRAASDAMINIRIGLSDCQVEGFIEKRTAKILVSYAKSLHFSERSWKGLVRAAPRLGIDSKEITNLKRYLIRESPDQKKADAQQMLTLMKLRHSERSGSGELPQREPLTEPAFEFQPTKFWRKLEAKASKI